MGLDGTENLKSKYFEGEGGSGVELCSWTTGLSRKMLQKVDLVTWAVEDRVLSAKTGAKIGDLLLQRGEPFFDCRWPGRFCQGGGDRVIV